MILISGSERTSKSKRRWKSAGCQRRYLRYAWHARAHFLAFFSLLVSNQHAVDYDAPRQNSPSEQSWFDQRRLRMCHVAASWRGRGLRHRLRFPARRNPGRRLLPNACSACHRCRDRRCRNVGRSTSECQRLLAEVLTRGSDPAMRQCACRWCGG